MVTVTNKRKDLSVEGKFKMTREIGNGKKIILTYREFGLDNYSIQMIWKKRAKIISSLEWSRQRRMRFRNPERTSVDEALLKWV